MTTHNSVLITIYFRQLQDDAGVMAFVDHLLHEHAQVQDYEYEHVAPADAGDSQ